MAWFLTWVVQSLALCVVTAVLVRLPGLRARAAARAAVWSAALAGTALLALLPIVLELRAAPGGAGTASPLMVAAPVVLPALPASWLGALVAAWALGTLVWLVHAVREVARVARLKQACEPWTPDEARRIEPRVGTFAGGRSARLAWCDALDGPVLLGFGDPVVALPRVHGARLTDEELDHVVLHEMAHLRRRDDWAALVDLVLAGVCWPNPCVHLARRGVAQAREMACDDWAVRQTSAPVAYARCLTRVAELRKQYRFAGLASAATGARGMLARRVTRILDAGRRPDPRASGVLGLLTPVAVGALAIGLLQAPPIVVDGAQGGPAAAPQIASGTRASGPPSSGGAERTAPQEMAPAAASPAPAGVAGARRARQTPAAVQPAAAAVLQDAGQTPAASVIGEAAAPPPLEASPVPGVGTPGVPGADVPARAEFIVPNQNTPWWGRAARAGAATGEGATAAGRATASFFRRLGSSVSQSLNQ